MPETFLPHIIAWVPDDVELPPCRLERLVKKATIADGYLTSTFQFSRSFSTSSTLRRAGEQLATGMKRQLLPDALCQLDRFTRQYFQLENDLNFPDERYLRNDAFQQALESDLFSVAAGHGPPLRYQLRVLKLLIKKIEQSIQDWDEEGISDDLMNRLSSLISSSVPTEAASAQQKSYVAYALSSLASQDEAPPSITLLESRNLLAAGGTTGLRTWEAALHLGQYLCANYPTLVQGRAVLELGAGTGYISIICAKYLHASRVVATDGAEEVVHGIRDNFKLNGLQESPAIDAKELKWGCTLEDIGHLDFSRGEKVDIVLGADVTYDDTAITALTSTFEDLFNKHSGVQILIAATLRNLKTFSFFQESCHKRGYDFKEVDFNISPEKLQMGPFYPDKVPIRICLISRP